MPVKIRLMRIGAKRRPFYRVVAVDERRKRTGGYLELLGTYNPLTEPKEIKLKQDRIDEWVKNGAQLSVGYLRIIGKAPQRPARKSKKAASAKPAETAAPAAPATPPAEAPAETPAEEAVSETPAAVEETQAEAPVESETSLNEAPQAEKAEEAAEVFKDKAEETTQEEEKA